MKILAAFAVGYFFGMKKMHSMQSGKKSKGSMISMVKLIDGNGQAVYTSTEE